ncbi:MAG: D-aminoacyl-tRNA deacylase [Oscillospiraceae bacterium]
MKAVVQRVAGGKVTVDGNEVGAINKGLMVLLGVSNSDTDAELCYLADKIINLRIFEDEAGKMNLSLSEIGGELMVISQFTLYGNCKKGRRPSFIKAGEPAHAEKLYKEFIDKTKELGVSKVAQGVFGGDMKIDIRCDGPITILLDTEELMPKKQPEGE